MMTEEEKKEDIYEGEEEEIPEEIPPPDGGWGWAVVFASFMIHIATDGVTYSFGIFYVELLHYFEESKAATAWIASILVGVTLCSGPISSIFVNKYGCRAVTIAGSILASFSLLISVWAPNVTTLYFTIGLGTGLGFGLIYLPAIVCVTIYFEKLRSLATGIAVCGSGLGTLIFAPFIEYLIREFGWRGAMMITSALILNCIIFGILFRPIEPPTNLMEIPMKEFNAPETIITAPKTNGISNGFKNDLPTNGFGRHHSVSNVNHTTYQFPTKQIDKNHLVRITMSQPVLTRGKTQPGEHVKTFGSGIMHKRDIFYQGSVENIRKRSASLSYNGEIKAHKSSLMSLPNGISEKQQENGDVVMPSPNKKLNILQEMLDLSLLKDPVFILFVLSNFCTSIGFNIPYVYLIPQAEVRNISRKTSSYLLSTLGIANTIGRIVLGYFSDKPWINRLLVYNLSLTICGVSTVLSAFCYTFTEFAIYASVYGFTAGAYVGLTSVILVDLLGLDNLTNGFGLVLLFQGVASFLGPPIAGKLYDALKSYDPGFYVGGSMIAISGIMLFIIPHLQRRIKRKENRINLAHS